MPAMVLSVEMACWGDTYESTAPTTRASGGDRSERVQATSSGFAAAHWIQLDIHTKKLPFFLKNVQKSLVG